MAETYDFGEQSYFTTLVYPRWVEDPPLVERDVETRETEPPFRIGYGTLYRIPLTRFGLIVGRWFDTGGEEVERLQAALQGSDLRTDVAEIRRWDGTR